MGYKTTNPEPDAGGGGCGTPGKALSLSGLCPLRELHYVVSMSALSSCLDVDFAGLRIPAAAPAVGELQPPSLVPTEDSMDP